MNDRENTFWQLLYSSYSLIRVRFSYQTPIPEGQYNHQKIFILPVAQLLNFASNRIY